MTAKEFRSAGLEKLSADELAALNEWFNRFAVRLLSVAQGGLSDCRNPIETKMDGDFEGWDGETIFKLDNGQLWQQASYAYTYHYAYRPDVMIFASGSTCRMKVEGVSDSIPVKRLR